MQFGLPVEDQYSNSEAITRGNSAAVDYDSENGSPGPQVQKKRKRGRPSAASRAQSIDNGSTNGDAQGAGKRRKTGKQPAYEDPELKRMKDIMEACFEAVEDVDNPEEGHQCAGLFYKLPSKKDYAAYCKLDYSDRDTCALIRLLVDIMIPRPICMDQIKKKIDKMQYRSMQEYIDDFSLMFNNARHYNEDGSTVWKDANYMEQAFVQKYNELTQPPPPQAYDMGQGQHNVRVKTIVESDEE
jgi:ATP-dependent helicase STH1/SNF2